MKKGVIIGIAGGVVAAALVGIGVCAGIILNSPTVKLTNGVAKLFSEYEASTQTVNKALGMEKMDTAFMADKYKAVVDADLYDIDGMDEFSLGLNTTIMCDYKNRKFSEEIGISVAYYEALGMTLAVDDTTVYLDMPKLYDGSITFDTQNINEQINNSLFIDYLGMEEVDEEMSINVFENAAYQVGELTKEYKEDIKKLIKNAEIEKADGVLKLEIGEKSVPCKGYVVSVKEDDINALLKTYYEKTKTAKEQQYMLDSDVKVLVYMDGKNNIKQIQTEDDIMIEDSEEGVSFAARLLGEKNAFEDVQVKMETEVEGEKMEVDVSYASGVEESDVVMNMQLIVKAEKTDLLGMDCDIRIDKKSKAGDMDIEFNLADVNMKINGELAYDTDTKDVLGMDITNCEVVVDEEKVGSFDMSMRLEPLKEEINISPSKTYPIFEFTEEDFASFVLNVYEHLEDYGDFLNGIDLDLY